MKRRRRSFRRTARAAAVLVSLAAASGSATAGRPDHPIQLILFAGYQTFHMSEVNAALRDFTLLDPEAVGRGEEIEGGLVVGGGLKSDLSGRLSLGIEGAWMRAHSHGTATIGGLLYNVDADLPAVAMTWEAQYLIPVRSHVRIGGVAGVGYYFTTGKLRLQRDFLHVLADIDSHAFGYHGAVRGEFGFGSQLATNLTIGYRHARARSLRVDNVELRRPSGERIAPDWSGLMASLALVHRL